MEATCLFCGCKDSKACEGGCSWLYVDRDKGKGVCSSCGDKSVEAKVSISLNLHYFLGNYIEEGCFEFPKTKKELLEEMERIAKNDLSDLCDDWCIRGAQDPVEIIHHT